MKKLLNVAKQAISTDGDLPFAVYSSYHEQLLLNVPIANPILVVVLGGDKLLGKHGEIECNTGKFIFLSDSPAINMRNIPGNTEYFALIIEFGKDDFESIPLHDASKPDHILGEVSGNFESCLLQFIECTTWASPEIIGSRKREILQLLYHEGHTELASMLSSQKVSNQLHALFHEQNFQELTSEFICQRLALSESTLRRRLKAEQTSLQEVKDRAKMGLGLHLLQTTTDSIGLISEKCGYQSQSRFTSRFKDHFGLTPSELRKTKVAD